MKSVFHIKREERGVAVMAMIYEVLLQVLMVIRYGDELSPIVEKYLDFFVEKFHVSGFDPVSYAIVSDWYAGYNVFRHPLLAMFEYPLYLLNRLLMLLTGQNCAMYIVMVFVFLFGFYSVLFLYRIFREVLRLHPMDSALLTAMTYSFAYVMLACMVPDHFVFSLFLLLALLYISGICIRKNRQLKIWQSIALFFLTAGVSLNNGLKVFTAAMLVNGRHFFHWRYLLLAVILPAGLLWGGARLEHYVFVKPHVDERNAQKRAADRKAREQFVVEYKRQTGETDSATIEQEVKKLMRQRAHEMYVENQKKPSRRHSGKPIKKGEFMSWTDVTTSRLSTAVENLFGESVQLHQDYLLQDVLSTERPVIVPYRWVWNYVVEGIVFVLFLAGVWCGRRSRFLWIAMSWFLMDMALHMGLGFGINEIYIMSPQWLFIFTVSMGYLLRELRGRWLTVARAVILLTTLWLFAYNGGLLVSYMLG